MKSLRSEVRQEEKWANGKQESANSPQMKSLLILEVELLLELHTRLTVCDIQTAVLAHL